MEEIQAYNAEIVKDQQFESQVDIAKRYPRNLAKVIDNSITIATMDKETAKTCNYSVPRGGKNISGPSVHLARIVVQQYSNLRIESRTTHSDATQVYAEAVCFDLETNTAIKSTTSRSILNKEGRKFNNDMVILTGKVADAIAFRNAVYAVIPKAIIDKVYSAALNKITGQISTEEELITRRTSAITMFKDEYDVSEAEIVTYLGLNTSRQIKQNEIADLIGVVNSLKSGEFTVDEMFSRKKPSEKIKISAKNLKQDLADLKAYKISLDMITKKYNDSDLTDPQIKQIKEAGTITEARMDEIIKLCVDGNKKVTDFDLICNEKQIAEIYEALTDNA